LLKPVVYVSNRFAPGSDWKHVLYRSHARKAIGPLVEIVAHNSATTPTIRMPDIAISTDLT
jgi:hypothetical protein